jgi:hypothetical protein
MIMIMILFHPHHLFYSNKSAIAVDHPRRNIAPCKLLTEECNSVHYAMSCAEPVENDYESATYIEVIASVNCEKWIYATRRDATA